MNMEFFFNFFFNFFFFCFLSPPLFFNKSTSLLGVSDAPHFLGWER